MTLSLVNDGDRNVCVNLDAYHSSIDETIHKKFIKCELEPPQTRPKPPRIGNTKM